MKNFQKRLLSTTELAKLLGVSRITVFQKIKEGKIPATKVGRSYVINADDVAAVTGGDLTKKDKERIDKSVRRTVSEYGETLRLLGAE